MSRECDRFDARNHAEPLNHFFADRTPKGKMTRRDPVLFVSERRDFFREIGLVLLDGIQEGIRVDVFNLNRARSERKSDLIFHRIKIRGFRRRIEENTRDLIAFEVSSKFRQGRRERRKKSGEEEKNRERRE